jgi:hypothetical protein
MNAKNRVLAVALLVATILVWNAQSLSAEPLALARVEVTGHLEEIPLPVYADLTAASHEYALVQAPLSQLKQLKVSYQVLDPDTTGASYLIGIPRRPDTREAVRRLAVVLHDDGTHLILRADPGQTSLLAAAGLDVQPLGEPLVLTRPQLATTDSFTSTTQIGAMIAEVNQTDLYSDVGFLSGESPVSIGGTTETLTTRNTRAGKTVMMRFTQYVCDCLVATGCSVSYHTWTAGDLMARNVIGTKIGLRHPDEIVLVTAHVDDMPETGLAPGADDNASGSVGVMTLARIFEDVRFQRTIRFVLYTGEEQGLLGSNAYADKVYNDGDNVVAVYNMDMIAWDAMNGPTLSVYTRSVSNPGYSADMVIANLMVSVTNAYGLSGGITPVIINDGGMGASDHAPFWQKGFSAVLVIEDFGDFCANYHTSNDKLSTLNMAYYENAVKVAVGTVAHLAKPLPTSPAAVRDNEWLRLAN